MHSTVSTTVLDRLASIVGAAYLLVGDDVAAIDPGWHADNLGAGVVVSPASTDQVAAIVRVCHDHGISVVPQAGRTGLVGGSTSAPGQIVLSLLRINQIEPINATDRVAVVGAGCTLESLQIAAARVGLEPGIDLAARGSATIGGMVSTNAGGVMAFRNGVMRHRVLGLEAVLPDGSVFSDLTKVVKNSAGYDLKHLLIGAEGTLGVVTRVVVQLDPVPPATATALFALPSVAAALDLIRTALDAESGHLRAAEALWRNYITLTSEAVGWSAAAAGIELEQPIFLILSLGGNRDDLLLDAFGRLFDEILSRHPSVTGLVAASARQAAELWRLREDTDILYRTNPGAPSYDVSVPLSQIDDYVTTVQAGLTAIDPGLQPYIFGHLADGNLHIVFNRPGPFAPALTTAVEDVLYRQLRTLGGSFSAEHGVGSKRIEAMIDTTDSTKFTLMQRIKSTLDPSDMMNPGKVLPND